MAITLATTLRNNRADQITTFASTSAKIRIYTAAYATALVDCVCSASAFAAAASGGVLTLNSITAGTASASGTAAIARIYKSDGTTMVIEGLTVGVSASNINITNTTIATSDTVTVTSATITEGNP
ncbi:hypothetical protein UFOVP920_49 [uncultured Caudovirales phage]|uniref:Uncharacterized protein n=1 Tax=uncultured Caudovirales phage TaxID=2100421 RepID=A0A6J7XFJ2_9CAUD|nr:hypothetical protein UFOVP920_49 [uncultured Caudovirales phage]CAB4200562.1 hypothetical protein UFOVP1345_49 [uncultured Caudovirales phage]CAB5228909.1 hypothetical protein UFOVP1542_49 [uncultured Caudovirales phage]